MSLEEFIILLDSRNENTGYLGFSESNRSHDTSGIFTFYKALDNCKNLTIDTKVGGIGKDITIDIVKISTLIDYLKTINLDKSINILDSVQCSERYYISNNITKWTESSCASIVFINFGLIFQWLQVQREHHEYLTKRAIEQKTKLWNTIQK